jgi:anti-sigma regulatory factor (Ser/Thr protein kinase)
VSEPRAALGCDRVDCLVLPWLASSVAQARGFVAHHVGRLDTEDATLVASEMVTNGLVHGQGEIRLTVATGPGCVRIEVWDGAAAVPHLREVKLCREGGRGLHIMQAVCAAWGFHRDGPGKTVWAEIGR